MQIVLFHLMPYADLDLEAGRKAGTVWVKLPNKHFDPVKGHKLYNRYLDELEYAEELGFDAVAYGVNTDDTSDFRPGHRAAEQHAVLSPFLAVQLSKAEIRALSRAAGLPTAELPSSACLSSRLPYGTRVTPERLRQVDEGEERLRALGFRQVRLRHHGPLARVEVDPAELPRALDPEMARRIADVVKQLGFRWVSLDLDGYRTGSLNEALALSEPAPIES